MAHKIKNHFNLDISEKCYYKKDNSLVIIREFYFNHLKKYNEVLYKIYHPNSGREFNVPEYKISRSKEQKFKKSPFRELDYVYHLSNNIDGQPKCYEIISITELENGCLNYHCKELYNGKFEDFSQNQLSYKAHTVFRVFEEI